MAETERPDKELIESYLGGDHSAFEVLYQRYRKPLYGYLNKMLAGQGANVDDIYQKTWIKALKSLRRYQHRQSFFAWLARIAHNTAVDEYRRDAQHPTVDVDDLQLGDDGQEPWRGLASSELGQAIADAVQQLPEDQREVFLLRQRDVPFKEIAKLQDCSINTVLGRMHYAVLKLRQMLRDWRQP